MVMDERKVRRWIKQRRKYIKAKIRKVLRDLKDSIKEGCIPYAQGFCTNLIGLLEQLYLLQLMEWQLLEESLKKSKKPSRGC